MLNEPWIYALCDWDHVVNRDRSISLMEQLVCITFVTWKGKCLELVTLGNLMKATNAFGNR